MKSLLLIAGLLLAPVAEADEQFNDDLDKLLQQQSQFISQKTQQRADGIPVGIAAPESAQPGEFVIATISSAADSFGENDFQGLVRTVFFGSTAQAF